MADEVVEDRADEDIEDETIEAPAHEVVADEVVEDRADEDIEDETIEAPAHEVVADEVVEDRADEVVEEPVAREVVGDEPAAPIGPLGVAPELPRRGAPPAPASAATPVGGAPEALRRPAAAAGAGRARPSVRPRSAVAEGGRDPVDVRGRVEGGLRQVHVPRDGGPARRRAAQVDRRVAVTAVDAYDGSRAADPGDDRQRQGPGLALVAAGWEHIGAGAAWYAQRFVWRGAASRRAVAVPDETKSAGSSRLPLTPSSRQGFDNRRRRRGAGPRHLPEETMPFAVSPSLPQPPSSSWPPRPLRPPPPPARARPPLILELILAAVVIAGMVVRRPITRALANVRDLARPRRRQAATRRAVERRA